MGQYWALENIGGGGGADQVRGRVEYTGRWAVCDMHDIRSMSTGWPLY